MFGILYIFAIGIVGFGHPMTRAKLAPPFPIYTGQDFERVSKMVKKSTTTEFIAKAIKKHPNIDFGKVRYVNAVTDISLVCKTCGMEWNATPNSILNGSGCPHCGRTKLVLGVGINDVPKPTRFEGNRIDSYKTWKSMLERCYSKKYQEKEPAYIGCSVCEDWLHFSNFKEWFDKNYIEGYALDKDILVKGNKTYSPDTCCFVPKEINLLVSKCDSSKKEDGIIGVSTDNRCTKNKYVAILSKNGKNNVIGRFQSKKEAFVAYKSAKEIHIQEVSKRYYKDGKITERVYNALMNYKI